MKKILIIILFLSAFLKGESQCCTPLPVFLPAPYSTSFYRIGWLKADSGSVLANRDTTMRPKFAGTQVFWGQPGVDSLVWYWDGRIWRRDGRVYTAMNGLHMQSDTAELGGNLLYTTTVNGGSNYTMIYTSSIVNGGVTMQVTNSSSGGAILAQSGNVAVSGQSVNATGIYGQSTNGFGIQAASTNSTAIVAGVNPASTNTLVTVEQLQRTTSGTPAIGIGSILEYDIENSDFNSREATQLRSSLTNITPGTRTATFSIWNVHNGTNVPDFIINGDRTITLPSYPNSDTNRVLTTDVNGNLIFVTKGSGGGGGGGSDTIFVAHPGTTVNSITYGYVTGTDTLNLPRIVAGTGITLTKAADSSVTISAAGNQRFGVAGEDPTASQNRVFDVTNAFSFTFTGSQAGSATLYATNTASGPAIIAQTLVSGAYAGIEAHGGADGLLAETPKSNGVPLLAQADYDLNANQFGLTIVRTAPTHTANVALTTAVKFQIQDDAAQSPEVSRIMIVPTAVTNGAFSADMRFYNINAGNMSNPTLTLTTGRSLLFNSYGVGTHTGTAAFALAVDASGNVIETTAATLHTLYAVNLLYAVNDSTIGMGVNPATQNLKLNFQNAFTATLDSLSQGLFFTKLTTQNIDTTNNKVLVWNTSTGRVQPMYWAGGGGGAGMVIGNAITGGTSGSVLFAGASGKLSQINNKFFFDSTNTRLEVGGNSPTYTIQADGILAAVNGSSFIYSDPSFPSSLANKWFQNGVGDWRLYLTGNGTGGNLAFEFKNTNSSLYSSLIAKEIISGTPTFDQSIYGGALNWVAMRYTSGNNFFQYYQEAGARNVFGFGFPTGQDYTDFRMNGATTVTNGSLILRMHDTQKMEAPGSLEIGSTTSATSTLHVTGSVGTAYVEKTGNYTLTSSDFTVNVTSGTNTQTLPTAVGCAGRIYNISNSGAGVVTIATTSSQTFVNVGGTPTTLTLSTVGNYQVQSTGANWVVL